MADKKSMTVALGGLGAVGLPTARALDAGLDGLELVAVSAGDKAKAEANMAGFNKPVPVVELEELADLAEVVVECAPPEVFGRVAYPAVKAGRIFMPVSVGQMLFHQDLVPLAETTGARIIVPSGALIGLDGVRAAAEGQVDSVRMITRKPPKGLAKAPLVKEKGIDVLALTEPYLLFEGSPREAIAHFPANINVAVALSLAGIGPDRTELQIWADPGVSRNSHKIIVQAEAGRYEMTIEGVPSETNPATGKLTPLSVIAVLKGLVSPLRIGA